MRILIAEDERDLNRLLAERLKAEHYSVDACLNGREALDYLAGADYDALILDIMMPKADGLQVLKTVRRQGKTMPVLLLTARDSVEDRVNGLDAGANDYLVKPFAFEELLARVRVLLRRPGQPADSVLRAADLELHLHSHKVFRDGREIPFSGREFALLRYLMQNEGIVLSREQLEGHLFNYDYMGSSNVIDVYIRHLRKKMDDGFEPKLIHTVRGAGYVFREE